jgi:hypothetical protein
MKKIFMLAAALLCFSGAADAKWWIFGKTGGEIGLKYLYVNKVSADEAGAKMTVFRETLGADGQVKITGKASVGKSAVGSVRISLDDKATWQDVKFSENGAFEYSFRPEQDKTYALLIEITDTAGKTNKVDETRKEIVLSAENIQVKVREALDSLFDAYSRENLPKFMAGVGEDFAGDKGILERAVKRDFDALSNINMRYTINNVAAGAQGRVFVSVTSNRMVLVNKTGATSTDSGFTEFVFHSAEGKLSLYSMKQPLMFGLSDAENVATGTAQGGGAGALVLDDSGNLGTGQLVSIACTGTNAPAYKFSTGEKACGPNFDIWFYEAVNGIGYYNTFQAKEFTGPLSDLTSTEVRNLSGYAGGGNIAPAAVGNSYCFNQGADFYCVEPASLPATGSFSVTFRVKKF